MDLKFKSDFDASDMTVLNWSRDSAPPLSAWTKSIESQTALHPLSLCNRIISTHLSQSHFMKAHINTQYKIIPLKSHLYGI